METKTTDQGATVTSQLNVPGYVSENSEVADDLGLELVIEPAYTLTGPRGARFDVLRDTRNGNLWAVNLKRSGYIPAALSGNLRRFEVGR